MVTIRPDLAWCPARAGAQPVHWSVKSALRCMCRPDAGERDGVAGGQAMVLPAASLAKSSRLNPPRGDGLQRIGRVTHHRYF